MAKQEFDVVGGKSDGKKYTSYQPKPPIWMTLDDEKYIQLRFARDPADGSKGEVTIFMLADTKPSDAMKIWRERQNNPGIKTTPPVTEPEPEQPPPEAKPIEPAGVNPTEPKTVEMARKFVAAPHTKDPVAFCEMGEKVLEELGKLPMFVGRGRLMIELATKIADVRLHPEKYAPKAAEQPGRTSKPKPSTAGTQGGSIPPRRTPTPEESAKSMGALPVPTDPDDEPW